MKRILFWLIPIAFLATFYIYPLASILKISLERTQTGILTPVLDVFNSISMLRVIGFTFGQAGLSTLLTLIVGLPGAYLIARYRFRGKALFRALTGVPFVMPTLVTAMAFDSLLGVHGWVNVGMMSIFHLESPPLEFSYTLWAILLAHIFYNTTIVLRIVGDYWSRLDPRLANAARVLGASQFQTWFNITLPLLMPAIAAASLLVFIFDFTSFGVILVLGGPHFATLETEIYYQTTALFNLPLAAVLSILQLIFTLGMMLVYSKLIANLARPLPLRSQMLVQRPFGSWRRRIFAVIVLGVLLTLLILPLVSLAARSFIRIEGERGQLNQPQKSFTLDFYRQLVISQKQSAFTVSPATAIAISLGYGLSTVFFSLLLGIPAAWSLTQSNLSNPDRHTRMSQLIGVALNAFLMLPLGTSAVTLGLGFIVAFNHPPFDLGSSPILIPLAHTLVAFPFVVRSLTPALQSIQSRLRYAAITLGASPRQVFYNIDMPIIGRAVLVSAVFAFSISLGEFGASSLLARPEYPTVPVAIYRYLSHPGASNYGQALALSTILMVICTLSMVAIERFRVAGMGEF
ncbi:MAG: iron ABC transporter permease [Chloroflexota bacterium]